MTYADLLDMTTRIVLTDQASGADINACQDAGIDILTACTNLYGWADPLTRIAHGDMNAVHFVQALHLARRQQTRRQA